MPISDYQKQLEFDRERHRRDREVRAQEKQAKAAEKIARNQGGGGTRFHGLYCLLVGWWLSMFLICMIFPLFFSGGRRLIKKAFGIW